MTPSGGLYSIVWNKKQPPSEKHWSPISNKTKTQYSEELDIYDFNKDICFGVWLLFCKQYEAEYIEEEY